MAEHDPTYAVLEAVRDQQTESIDWDRVARRTADRMATEIEHERRGVAHRRFVGRLRSDWLPIAVTIGVSMVVATVAVTALHSRGTAGQRSAASAQGLIARLAVLRRPQTAADRLPALIRADGRQITTVPGLTRLSAVVPGAKLYLVVTPPAQGGHEFWPPGLGDQVSVLAVTSYGARENLPIPAADLYDPDQILTIPTRRSVVHRGIVHAGEHVPAQRVSYAAVVPDGVTRVVWLFETRPGGPTFRITATVANNLAYTPRTTDILFGAEWYGQKGKRIHTSTVPYRRVVAQRQNQRRDEMLKIYSHYHYRAAPSVLKEYSVFSITSRTPVEVAPGITISHPLLSSLPFTAVNFADPREPPQLDPSQIRQITDHGIKIWVVPGAKGICLSALQRSRIGILGGGGTGGASSCASNLRQATQGVGFSSGGAGFRHTTYMILPTTHPTYRVRTGPHSYRTIRPPYGIYIHRARHPQTRK